MANRKVRCPLCSSKRVKKRGFRYLESGKVKQHYICKKCHYYFVNITENGVKERDFFISPVKNPIFLIWRN